MHFALFNGLPSSSTYSVGAQADSAYEYLLKQWLMTNKTEGHFLDMCRSWRSVFVHSYSRCGNASLYRPSIRKRNHRAHALRVSQTPAYLRDRHYPTLPASPTRLPTPFVLPLRALRAWRDDHPRRRPAPRLGCRGPRTHVLDHVCRHGNGPGAGVCQLLGDTWEEVGRGARGVGGAGSAG